MPTLYGTGLSFSIDMDARNAAFAGEGYTPARKQSFWRMLLDDGVHLEMLAESSEQAGRACLQGETLVIAYDRIRASGRVFNIGLTVRVSAEDGLLAFTAEITNREANVRVNECACPLLEAEALGGPPAQDVLYLPHGLGQRIPDPWNALRTWHSNYMDGEEEEVVRSLYYPEASMAWLGVESGGRFLYMGRHDPEIHGTVMQAGCSPYGRANRLSLRFVHLPMARTGETVAVPPTCVGYLPGGWTAGAETYRRWADQGFYRTPPHQPWIQHMNGWQRIIMRSQYGVDYYLPEDLPALYEEGARHGVDSLFLFGWWDTGMDNGYPEYPISPQRARALKENIAKVRAMGGHVILVCNANFIDADTAYGRQHGREYTQLDRRGHVRFRKCCYSPYSATRPMRMFGDSPLFLYPCSGVPQWRDQLIAQFAMLKEYEPDCIFYDCYGIEPNGFCFNDRHQHGNRVDEEWPYKRRVLRQLEEACGSRYAFATEQVTDIAAAYTQFIHGCRGSFEPEDPFTFPQLFRQTFPEVITTNRLARDSRPGFEANLRFAFLMGLRYDVEIYRCRRGIESEMPYAREVERLNALRQQYGEFLLDGRFDVSALPPLPQGVLGSQYISQDGRHRLTVLWNMGGTPATACGEDIAPNQFRIIREAI